MLIKSEVTDDGPSSVLWENPAFFEYLLSSPNDLCPLLYHIILAEYYLLKLYYFYLFLPQVRVSRPF